MSIETEESLEQSFGNDPTKVRDTHHYKDEYVNSFVDKWDNLIGWKNRELSEGDFFIKTLRRHGARKILDVATGTGFHSIRLLKAGFDVVSADGSPVMLAKAFENGVKNGYILRTVQADWRFLNRDIHGEYDAIICLGNSFTHLFDENDRRKALAEYYAMLKHDGILIIDQRNYDAILDNGYSSKHTYYYCGDNVKVEPEYVDSGLARFKYIFPEETHFHLNMFPLRKKYMHRLLKEVGFQNVETYGDFQETYHDHEPDFFIHVVEKKYKPCGESVPPELCEATNIARDYYNSGDADNYYCTIWGGEDIHIGLYNNESEDVATASSRTVDKMFSLLKGIDSKSRVLDIGAGYGGAARAIAKKAGCSVSALNLSEKENQRDREMNRQQGLDKLVTVIDGSFESIPFPDNSFDVVWSQDAILHSGNREQVIAEVSRVLKAGGQFIFTDPMMVDDCSDDVLKPILERIHLETLGSPGFYRKTCSAYGLNEIKFHDLSEYLPIHYQRILEETEAHEETLKKTVSTEYIQKMKKGLKHWIDGGKKGYLTWGIFHFSKE
ncbi:methyltransferase domain-containing protein [Chitinispirillales bacterium ANBcel5]|uniref:glycine/sarcosine N-methyltransferase n=1 Tax=Cellulosispirillum alkaliphilum TaxID=3039283 RepID=UPI002A562E83|nr:methyltransferase domain-containing protein [Chitinispirillales bacterium ANBcel5]